MQEMLRGFALLLAYFVPCAAVALIGHYFIKIPKEVFRKILHCILLFSLIVFVFGFDTWWRSALAAVIFELVVYPALWFFERFKGYSELTTERKKGELKNSLLLVFTMFAVVISVCWGWLGDKYLVLASVYAWGFGDAAAALVGKRFGRHKLHFKYLDGKKSLEGTLAMFALSFFSVAVILQIRGGMPVLGGLVTALVTAEVAALVELYSRGGNDTFTCPLASMAVMLPLLHLFGGGI